MDALACLMTRRTATRLVEPGPTTEQLAVILSAATTAPDHKMLRPWRFVVVRGEARATLATAIAEAAQAVGTLPEPVVRKAAGKATRSPALIAVVAARVQSKVPVGEQDASAAAAAQNICLAAHALGLASAWKSGARRSARPSAWPTARNWSAGSSSARRPRACRCRPGPRSRSTRSPPSWRSTAPCGPSPRSSRTSCRCPPRRRSPSVPRARARSARRGPPVLSWCAVGPFSCLHRWRWWVRCSCCSSVTRLQPRRCAALPNGFPCRRERARTVQFPVSCPAASRRLPKLDRGPWSAGPETGYDSAPDLRREVRREWCAGTGTSRVRPLASEARPVAAHPFGSGAARPGDDERPTARGPGRLLGLRFVG